MKKRILSVLLVVAMTMVLIACGATNETNNNVDNSTTIETTTPNDKVVDEVVPENNTVISESDGESVPETEVIHEHNYVENVVKEATCLEDGTTDYTCNCGDTYEEAVPATGHTWSDYTANGDATYLADGTKTAKCSSCEATDTVVDEGSKLAYTYTDCEAVKYAQQTVNVRSGPSTDFDKVGSLSTNQEVTVTGTCNETGWYRIVLDGSEAFVSNKYLGDSKVEVQQSTGGGSGGGNSLAAHFGVTLPFAATYNNGSSTTPWSLVWNSNTSFNPDTNYICKISNGTQVTISDLSGSKNDCLAYVTMSDGTSGWVQFGYNGYIKFTW